MTREEAIGKINAIKKYLTAGNPIWDVREIDEALNMAIEALQQEPKTGEWIPCSERLPEEREDYELATEQMEHDIIYEPTYNSEDGSM